MRKLALACSTCIPLRVTVGGSRDSAFLSLFCTSTWARFGSVPGLKVAVISAEPLELLDWKYSRLRAPLSSCSMMLVTVSSTTFADAPAYDAAILTCGGATSGYFSTERRGIASIPAKQMKIATTQAKLGRSMKNLDMRMFRFRVLSQSWNGRSMNALLPGIKSSGLSWTWSGLGASLSARHLHALFDFFNTGGNYTLTFTQASDHLPVTILHAGSLDLSDVNSIVVA